MEEFEMMQDQDNANETSNSGTEVGDHTAGNIDAPSAVGNEGAGNQRVLVAEPEPFFRKNGFLMCLQRSEYRLPFV